MIFQKIKELADGKNMSIRELERLAGLENGTIGKWRNSIPRFDNIASVASVLEVPLETFVGGGGTDAES